MKKLLFLLITGVIISCSTEKKAHSYLNDSGIAVTRRCIGNYIDYNHTGPEVFGGVNLIWIRTTQFNSFGKISAYGKDCKFEPGEKIYIKRMFSTPGPFGNWEYQLENDSADVYRLSNYRYENNVLVMAMF
jgi:hypothetical protein